MTCREYLLFLTAICCGCERNCKALSPLCGGTDNVASSVTLQTGASYSPAPLLFSWTTIGISCRLQLFAYSLLDGESCNRLLDESCVLVSCKVTNSQLLLIDCIVVVYFFHRPSIRLMLGDLEGSRKRVRESQKSGTL